MLLSRAVRGPRVALGRHRRARTMLRQSVRDTSRRALRPAGWEKLSHRSLAAMTAVSRRQVAFSTFTRTDGNNSVQRSSTTASINGAPQEVSSSACLCVLRERGRERLGGAWSACLLRHPCWPWQWWRNKVYQLFRIYRICCGRRAAFPPRVHMIHTGSSSSLVL